MAKLVFRTINEMVGCADMLKVDEKLRTPKTAHLDLSAILKPAWQMRPGAATYRVRPQDHKLYIRLDNKFIDEAKLALTEGTPVVGGSDYGAPCILSCLYLEGSLARLHHQAEALTPDGVAILVKKFRWICEFIC